MVIIKRWILLFFRDITDHFKCNILFFFFGCNCCRGEKKESSKSKNSICTVFIFSNRFPANGKRGIKEKKIYLGGYLTIEASFIMPMVFILLLFLIYWGFYCYDKSVSIQCSYLAALRGSNEWELSNAEVEQYTKQQLEVLTKESLLYLEAEEVCANAGLLHLEAGIKGGIKVPFLSYRAGAKESWMIEEEKTAYQLKPASFIRKYRIIGK